MGDFKGVRHILLNSSEFEFLDTYLKIFNPNREDVAFVHNLSNHDNISDGAVFKDGRCLLVAASHSKSCSLVGSFDEKDVLVTPEKFPGLTRLLRSELCYAHTCNGDKVFSSSEWRNLCLSYVVFNDLVYHYSQGGKFIEIWIDYFRAVAIALQDSDTSDECINWIQGFLRYKIKELSRSEAWQRTKGISLLIWALNDLNQTICGY